MPCYTIDETNQRLENVAEELRKLVHMAYQDQVHALEHAATETAQADFRRERLLSAALTAVEACKR